MLTDKNIRKVFKEKGIEMSKKEIQQIFTNSRRLYFAINNILDPLEGINSSIKGDIFVIGGKFITYVNKKDKALKQPLFSGEALVESFP